MRQLEWGDSWDDAPSMIRELKNLRKLQISANSLAWRVRQKAAGTLVEYAFIVAIISIAAVAVLAGIGKRANDLLEMTNSNMPK
jgi:Flp pilus assembly pilin Flp